MGFFSKLFDPSAGEIKRLNKIVDKIDSFEEEHKALTDEQLRGKTVEFRRGQGTFDPAAIARIIQFIHSVALFSKFVTGPKQVTIDRYEAFVQKHLSSHKELTDTLLKGDAS